MAIVINGSGTITGVSAGGLPDGSVDSDTLATGIDATKLADGTVTSAELQYINSLSSNAQTQISAAGLNSYAGFFAWDIATATGTFTPVSGLSFQPTHLILFSTAYAQDKRAGWGFMGDGVSPGHYGIISQQDSASAGTFNFNNGYQVRTDGSNMQTLTLSTMTSDGFTLANTKTGTPTGSLQVAWLALG